MAKEYVITKVIIGHKYAEFTLDDGRVFHGKAGYFYGTIGAILDQFNEEPKPPYRVKLDSNGERYFHVDRIFHKGFWVGLKGFCDG